MTLGPAAGRHSEQHRTPPPWAEGDTRRARPRHRRTHLLGAVLALHLRSSQCTSALARLPSCPRRRGCRTGAERSGAERNRQVSSRARTTHCQPSRPRRSPWLCLPLLSPQPGSPRGRAASPQPMPPGRGRPRRAPHVLRHAPGCSEQPPPRPVTWCEGAASPPRGPSG